MTKTAKKTIPFGAAHTYIAHIIEFKIKKILNHFLVVSTVCGGRSLLGLTDQFTFLKQHGKDFFRVNIKLNRNYEFLQARITRQMNLLSFQAIVFA